MDALLGGLFMAVGVAACVAVVRRTGDILHPLGLMLLFWFVVFGFGHWNVAATYDEPYYAFPFEVVTYFAVLGSIASFVLGYWLIDPSLERVDGALLGARLRGCVREEPL